MTPATIEHELAQLLEHSGYEVRFRHAGGYNWFYVYVLYDGAVIGERSCCRSYPRAARWARRKIRSHAKALRKLGPLVKVERA